MFDGIWGRLVGALQPLERVLVHLVLSDAAPVVESVDLDIGPNKKLSPGKSELKVASRIDIAPQALPGALTRDQGLRRPSVISHAIITAKRLPPSFTGCVCMCD